MTIQTYLGDNAPIMEDIYNHLHYTYNLIYADYVYEDRNFEWVGLAYQLLDHNGIFIVQTDHHTSADIFLFMRDILHMTWVNTIVYKQEWGGAPRNRFSQKHDDVHIFCKGSQWKWYGDRVQIPKATAGTKLDKKGTGLKTPCSVWDDLGNFSTLDRERVKQNGKNIRWQKPLKFMNRLLLPFTDEGDWILDPFAGSGTTGKWCIRNNRNCTLIENDPEVYETMLSGLDLIQS